MSFTKQTLNYAEDYKNILAQAFPYVLNFGDLYETPNNGRYKWIDAKTIKLPHIKTSGRVAGDTDTIHSKARRFNTDWKTLSLRNHREWETLVHPTDINFTNGAASIQNITQVYNNEQKFPEMDAYLVSRLYADWRLLGKVPFTDTLTVDNVIAVFDRMMERMTNKRIPATGRILYVTPDVETLIKSAVKIQREVGVAGTTTTIDRAISNLDKVKIVPVPEELMKTVYDFTEGWEVGSTARQIKMLLIHPLTVVTPVSYEFAQLDVPSAGSAGKYDYYEESYEDVFILPYKEDGIEFVIEPTDIDALTFSTAASTAAGAVAGDCKITVSSAKKHESDRFVFKVASGTAPTAPILGEVLDKSWNEFESTEVESGITNGYKMTVVEINADGRAVATANGTVTSKT